MRIRWPERCIWSSQFRFPLPSNRFRLEWCVAWDDRDSFFTSVDAHFPFDAIHCTYLPNHRTRLRLMYIFQLKRVYYVNDILSHRNHASNSWTHKMLCVFTIAPSRRSLSRMTKMMLTPDVWEKSQNENKSDNTTRDANGNYLRKGH